jgi:hypothetical protein
MRPYALLWSTNGVQDIILHIDIYLNSRRAEEGAQRCIVHDLRLVGAIIGLYNGLGVVRESESFLRSYKKEAGMMHFNFLERQLHVFFVVIIVQIFAPIMHGKEVDKAHILIQGLMFQKMPDQ